MGRAYEVRKASIQKTGAIKAKAYSNFAKEIYLAAKKGIPEIGSNISLKRIVDKAKKEQVPNDIIERAIEKAKGAGLEAYESVIYEGFGPGASTLIIKTLTDNVNRTVSYVRAAFNKVSKSLGVKNSVAYNYDYLAILGIRTNKEEELLLALLEANIEPLEFENDQGTIFISLNPTDVGKAKDVIDSMIENVDYEVDEVGMFPKEKVTLNTEDLMIFKKLYYLLDEIEDVVEIYHNVEGDF